MLAQQNPVIESTEERKSGHLLHKIFEIAYGTINPCVQFHSLSCKSTRIGLRVMTFGTLVVLITPQADGWYKPLSAALMFSLLKKRMYVWNTEVNKTQTFP